MRLVQGGALLVAVAAAACGNNNHGGGNDLGSGGGDLASAAGDLGAGGDLATPGAMPIARVLLLSIDGMHALDLTNFVAAHPGSALAKLQQRGVTYTNAWVNTLDGARSNPSDSFPGLLALTTGGSSATTGGWYDVSYARDLYTDKTCATQGTMVAYDESLDLDNNGLWGHTASGTGPTHDINVVRARLDVNKMPYRKTLSGCSPVLPHNYIRVNTIFEVAHHAGLRTAWSDKHLAYEMVSGPSGSGLDDFFAPEINSLATNLPGTGAAAGESFTSKYTYTEAYDDLKVRAILNQIDGKWSDDGLTDATDAVGTPGTPAIFGMNFQALSVAQKSAKAGEGGYTDANGTPGSGTADALVHTDASIGKMIAELEAKGLTATTLVIVTAKHGQSPIDNTLVVRKDGDAIAGIVNAAAPLAGHIEDDVALYWLKDSSTAAAGVAALQAAAGGANDPLADAIFSTATASFAASFGDPARDPRTPDLIVKTKRGVIYSLSAKKWAEHGGFAEDDAHVMLLVSNPSLAPKQIDTPVRTKQVAPTILAALGLDPSELQAVAVESTKPLPGLPLPNGAAWSPLRWTTDETPVPVTISGGPWSLLQLAPGTPAPPPVGTPITNVSYGYCSANVRQGNPGVAPMAPYYFPMVLGDGQNLQGFFDWRPKDINEGIVAAKSSDNGKTWTFQQDALYLTEACPADQTKTNPNATQADNGFGHPYLVEVGGVARLYLLDRSDASVDNLGLVVQPLAKTRAQLAQQPDQPLQPAPTDAPASGLTRTSGLLNPDGILAVVPGSSPVEVLYVQKQKGADNSGATALPASQQCGAQPFLQPGQTTPKKANHDLVTIRLASTTDGVSFTDLGPVAGLNDPAATSYLGTRYLAPSGTMLKLDDTHYGLFFAGGNCIDADSDAFHYIGYAESTDLKHWSVVNGIGNPILSVATNVLPLAGAAATIPAAAPVAGASLAWWQARVYAPSVTRLDATHVTVTFAGYSVQSPTADLLHYRQIGHVVLTASRPLP